RQATFRQRLSDLRIRFFQQRRPSNTVYFVRGQVSVQQQFNSPRKVRFRRRQIRLLLEIQLPKDQCLLERGDRLRRLVQLQLRRAEEFLRIGNPCLTYAKGIWRLE